MIVTTPNLEAVRRVCILSGASLCYIYVPKHKPVIDILINIDKKDLDTVQRELESWCGMKFNVICTQSKEEEIKRVRGKGYKILPISQ